MSEYSAIEWTDHTFNPWIGCEKISQGCKNCYAERLNSRYGWAEWGKNGQRTRTGAANWRKPLAWNKSEWAMCVDKRCGWRGDVRALENDFCPRCRQPVTKTRQRVFTASLADVFEARDELVAWREDLFALIDQTPNLDWLILTKRPENVNRMIDASAHPNVWIGASVENQEQADLRIPALLNIPASVKFLSMEPLLGEVDIRDYVRRVGADGWVIVGGESGPGARTMQVNWVRSVRSQCIDRNVPFFFKQWGAWKRFTTPVGLPQNIETHDFGDGYVSARYGKKTAGRILDGRTWDEYPEGENDADD